MNNNLRSIVRRHIQEKSLKMFLKDKYDDVPVDEKLRFLDAVEDSIEIEVENILSAFIEDARKGSPEIKRRKHRSYLNLIVTIISTPGIAFSVNEKNWIMCILFSLLLLGVQIYIIREEY